MAKHPDQRHLRVFKFSVKSANKNQKVKKWLESKVCLAFFKNTIQPELPMKYTAKINFVSTST